MPAPISWWGVRSSVFARFLGVVTGALTDVLPPILQRPPGNLLCLGVARARSPGVGLYLPLCGRGGLGTRGREFFLCCVVIGRWCRAAHFTAAQPHFFTYVLHEPSQAPGIFFRLVGLTGLPPALPCEVVGFWPVLGRAAAPDTSDS